MNKLKTVNLRPNPKRVRRRRKNKSSAGRRLITKKSAGARKGHCIEVFLDRGRGLTCKYIGRRGLVRTKSGARYFETVATANAAGKAWMRKNSNMKGLRGARVVAP